jgi:P4 family phage/plasmid primase-like protien
VEVKKDIWDEMGQFVEMYLTDPAMFQKIAPGRCRQDNASWRSFEAEVKKRAKQVQKDRAKAEAQAKRDDAKAEREARQQACAQYGAPHMQRGTPAEVSTCLTKYLSAKHGEGLVHDEGHFWLYQKNTGAWSIITERRLQGIVQSWDGVATVGAEAKPWGCTNSKLPVDMAIADLEVVDRGPGYFKGCQVGIAFADGHVGIDKAGELKFSPNKAENRCRFALPLSIRNAKLEGSRFEQMQLEQFGSLTDSRCRLLWEWVGFCLLGKITDANKALILFGPGGSGKGTLLRIIQACFPEDAIGSIQPQRWGHGASLDVLARIRLNAVNEMNTDDMTDVGRIKSVISGDRIEAEPKFKTPYSFCPSAGHIFTVNPGQLPTVPDADEPFWDRWLCVPVERVYRGTAEQDMGLAQHIIDNEIHIVVSFALQMATQAIKRRAFTRCQEGEQVIREWKEGVNPVANFLAERTMPYDGAARNAPTLTEVFVEYQKWCFEAGHKPSSRTVLGRRLTAMGRMERSNGARVLVKLTQPYHTDDSWVPI